MMLNGNVACNWLWSIFMGTLMFPSLLPCKYIYILYLFLYLLSLLSMLSRSLTYVQPNIFANSRY